MAVSLLFIAITVFAIRGFFLGFVGVIGKVLGLILGYIIALSFRSQAADWISKHMTVNVPSMVVEIGCGVLLFFTTLFTVGFLVVMLASMIKSLIPPLKPLLDDKSTAGRITGALSNGLLGAVIVLLGIWGYGFLGKGAVQPTQLQQVANKLGNALFETVKKQKHFSFSNSTTTIQSLPSNTQPHTGKRHAFITSESDPTKVFSINHNNREIAQSKPPPKTNELVQLLGNDKIQELINNPQLQQFAIKQLQKNPQQLSDLNKKVDITPEKLQQLLEKFSQQQ